ncbi:MAG: GIY-YIG nuclease family protein [Gammaproteobacteria bacterium]|nr:GIY-YIG nuclease family protein [Gammaproteobacteria bacterium]MDH5728388.1 GIY-YIG nuclease family protein [Gammaproteobacteria bacterium]
MSAWFVYILLCADDSLYTGITRDLEGRLEQHNYDDKLGAKYTRGRRPVSLVYQEELPSRSAAAKREYAIKRLSKQNKLALINAD